VKLPLRVKSLGYKRKTMVDVQEAFLHAQLLERRQRLQTALASSRQNENLRQLLSEVDSALDRMEAGTFGLCETCHDTVEKDRLISDPLVRYCLDHLTASQRRTLEEDLELASQLQRGLLPRPHQVFAGWEVCHHYQPFGLVSGDYCDVVTHQNESEDVYFALGDVSGKGVAACMLMSQRHAIFRTLVVSGLTLQALVERASRVFCQSTLSSLFATLVLVRAGQSGEIEVCNAGHCPALLLQSGNVVELGATGVPLGLFCEGAYPTQKTEMACGDTLLLYTDGVSEARSNNEAEYGGERLKQLIASSPGLSAQALVADCIADLNGFRAGAPLLDDLTIMAIRRAA
jgi:sigma-B regulation protein RsbU (phosphoserine phosphatase)